MFPRSRRSQISAGWEQVQKLATENEAVKKVASAKMYLVDKVSDQLAQERAQADGLVTHAADAVESTQEIVQTVRSNYVLREGWNLFSDMVGLTDEMEGDWQDRLHMAEIGEYDIANRPASSEQARDIQALATARVMVTAKGEEYDDVDEANQLSGMIQ